MPPVIPWETLRNDFEQLVREQLRERPSLGAEHSEQVVRFSAGRLDEGRRIAEFFRARRPEIQNWSALDVGAGDGGVGLGAANAGFRVAATDLGLNHDFLDFVRRRALAVTWQTADGCRLPYLDGSFDAVICVEVFEHVPGPSQFGAEIMRVLRSGGMCMITTPARLRHLVRPDPHFGVKGLLLLPDALQKYVVIRKARKVFGDAFTDSMYDVHHIYSHTDGITRHFPGPRNVEVLWDYDYRGPRTIRDRLWYAMRNFLWDRIVITKG